MKRPRNSSFSRCCSCSVVHPSTYLRPRNSARTSSCPRILEWLNFVKGLVDSEDHTLSKTRSCTCSGNLLRGNARHVAETAEKKHDSKEFCEQFGNCLKLVTHKDFSNRTKIAELLGFSTSSLVTSCSVRMSTFTP